MPDLEGGAEVGQGRCGAGQQAVPRTSGGGTKKREALTMQRLSLVFSQPSEFNVPETSLLGL